MRRKVIWLINFDRKANRICQEALDKYEGHFDLIEHVSKAPDGVYLIYYSCGLDYKNVLTHMEFTANLPGRDKVVSYMVFTDAQQLPDDPRAFKLSQISELFQEILAH